MRAFLSRLTYWIRRRQFERDLTEEIETHRVLRQAHFEASGMAPDQAARASGRALGNITLAREDVHDIWVWRWLDDFVRDLRHAVRLLRRSPGFTAVAVLSLALGIGGTTAVFSILNPLLLTPLPVPAPAELISVRASRPDIRTLNSLAASLALPNVSRLEFERLRERSGGFLTDAFLATTAGSFRLDGTAAANQELRVAFVSTRFFSTLQVVPFLGRTFVDEDQKPNAAAVAVISYGLWRRAFGEDRRLFDRDQTIRLDSLGRTVSVTVVGVAPPGFDGTEVGIATDVWRPIGPPSTAEISPRDAGWWLSGGRMVVRLRPEVPVRDARTNLESIYRGLLEQWAAQFGAQLTPAQRAEFLGQHITIESAARGWGELRTQFSRPLLVLTAAVGSILLIACANIAALMLAGGMARRRDVAVRLAIGCGRLRLIREHLTASLTLAMTGGALGLILSSWATRALLYYAPPLASSTLDFKPGLRVLGFALLASIVSALLFGVLPAWRLTDRRLTAGFGSGPTGAHVPRRLTAILVPLQIALSLVLLVGAGLFLRTLHNLRGIDVGFEKHNVLRVEVNGAADYQSILARLDALPGIESATAWGPGLLNGGVGSVGPIVIDGDIARPPEALIASFTPVGPRFFETMGIPIVEGRGFRPDDTRRDGPAPRVVSASLARVFFGTASPVGRRFRLDRRSDAPVFEIIGVARDAKYSTLREESPQTIYAPFPPGPQSINIAVRAAGDMRAIASLIRGALQRSGSGVSLGAIRTVDDVTEAAIVRERFLAQFSTVMGLLALFLACLGVYGTLSFAVTQRTPEIGIRMALGADAGSVVGLLMREAGWSVGWGAIVGVGAALATAHAVSSLLYGLPAADPVTLMVAVAVLGAAAALAAYLPARRGARVDPLVALRHD